MSGMGPDIDCPECGNYRIRPGVKMCAVCETCARYEKKIAVLESRLQIDPGGSYKIDELEQATLHLRAQVVELEDAHAGARALLAEVRLELVGVRTERHKALADLAAFRESLAEARARVAELEGQETLRLEAIRDLAQLRIEAPQLRARVAELEAPPVVPDGWEVAIDKWGNIGCFSYMNSYARVQGDAVVLRGVHIPRAVLRALEYAASTGKRPPHADDEVKDG